jgi:hypothetical protein
MVMQRESFHSLRADLTILAKLSCARQSASRAACGVAQAATSNRQGEFRQSA